MVARQRPRRLCRRDHRRQPDQALSRPADRADRLAARAAADPRQSGRDCFRGRSVLAAVHQPLEQRRHRAGGPCPYRQFSSRLFRPGMELRGRGPSDRGADLDGARRPHHLCRVAVAAGGGYSRERPVLAADAARQRSRPSRHDIGRRFCARHPRGRRTSPAHRCGTFLADHSSARRHHRRQARLVSGFRAADGGRARPELDRQPSLHRRGDDTAGAWKVARHRCRARTGAVGRPRGRVAPTPRSRPRDDIHRGEQQSGPAMGARLDHTARPRRRRLRVRTTASERSRRPVDHRGLSVVRRLGPRHHDQPAGADPGDRSCGHRAPHPQDIRQLRQRGNAAQCFPRRRRSPGVQHRRCIAVVFRGVARLRRCDRRHRQPARGVPGIVRHDRMASAGHPLRDRRGCRGRSAQGRRGGRASDLDGRQGRRLGGHAPHRQAG